MFEDYTHMLMEPFSGPFPGTLGSPPHIPFIQFAQIIVRIDRGSLELLLSEKSLHLTVVWVQYCHMLIDDARFVEAAGNKVGVRELVQFTDIIMEIRL